MTDTDEAALLAAVLADTEDDTVRLAYADWLQEHGQGERGVWLRNAVRQQLGPYVFPPGMPAAFHVLCDANGDWEMMGRHYTVTLAGAIPNLSYTVARGFVESVACTADLWLRHAAAILASHPVRRVTLSDKRPSDDRGDGDRLCGFWRGESPAHPENNLPEPLWDELDKAPTVYQHNGGWCDFATPEAALLALSDICIAWGRRATP